MNTEIKRSWVNALRSLAGTPAENINRPGCYTPLRTKSNKLNVFGVLINLIDNTKWELEYEDAPMYTCDCFKYFLPSSFNGKCGLTDKIVRMIDEMKDEGLRFADLADFIEDAL